VHSLLTLSDYTASIYSIFPRWNLHKKQTISSIRKKWYRMNGGFTNQTSESITSDSFRQLKIFTHNCNSFRMNCTEVGIFKKGNHVGLCGLLESKDSLTLEANLLLKLSCYLFNQSLKRELSYQQLSLNN